MKRVIYLIVLILAVFMLTNCQTKQENEANQEDQPVISQNEPERPNIEPDKEKGNEKDKQKQEDRPSEAEIIYPKVSIDKEDLKEIAGMKNWEIVGTSIQMMGKSASEISADYQQWTFIDAAMGSVYYEDASTGLYYLFPAVRSLPDYVENTLLGDELCTGVAGSVQYFFPQAEWPSSIEGTRDYLTAYLGVDVELIDARDTEGSYSYKAEFPISRNYAAFLWTEDAVVTTETWIEFILQTLGSEEPLLS